MVDWLVSRFLRSRIFKIGYVTLLVLFLLAGLFIMAVPWFLSTDAIRVRLAQELSSWTGYSVHLPAPPQISFFPQLKASLSGVVLHSPDERGAPLMEAKRIEFDLSSLAAIRGRVSITETRIIAPKFTLNEPVKNVNDALQTIAGSQGALGIAIREAHKLIEQNPQNPDLSRLLSQPFGRIIIEDGTIDYHSFNKGPSEAIGSVNAIVDWPSSTRRASIIISGNWRGEKTELRMDAEQALILAAHGISPIRLSVNSRRGGLTFIGKARFDERFFFDGKLSGRSPGWGQTMKWLGLEHTLGVGIKEPIVWESSLNAVPERIELNNVSFSIGDDSARGALEINRFSDRPMITGSLAFQSLNLNTLLAAYFPDEKIYARNLGFLGNFDFDVRLSSPEAQFSSLTLSNLAAAIQIRDGRAIFDLGNVNAFSGTLQSNIQIFNDNGAAKVEARISGSGVDSASILSALHYVPALSAKSNFTLTLQAPFTRWSQLATGMQGTFSWESSKGQFNGYQLSDQDERSVNENPLVIQRDDKQFFPFSRLAIKGDFSDASAVIHDGFLIADDQKYTFTGLVPLGIVDDSLTLVGKVDGPRDIVFNILRKPLNSSTTICVDVQCLQNSLMPPQPFFLSVNTDRLMLTTAIEKTKQE